MGAVTAVELTDTWQDVLVGAARILLVIVLALLVNALARRAIGRAADRVRQATQDLPGQLVRPERVQRAAARSGTLKSVLRSFVSIVVFTVAALVVLGQLDINMAPLIASAGIVSIAIGFGAQSLVRDVVAGIFILVEDQFGVGDIIDAGPATGTVEKVTLRATRLRDVAGTVWHVPNGSITRIGNKSQNWARALLDVTVAPHTDIRLARRIVSETADALADDPEWGGVRITGRPDDQGVQAFSPDGVTLRLMVDTEPASQWAVERELRQRIKAAFDAAGISLASAAAWPPEMGPPQAAGPGVSPSTTG